MALFEKTITDRWGDTAQVKHEDEAVIVNVTESGTVEAWLELTPRRARKLAKALRKAARRAEATAASNRAERYF